MAIRRPLVSAPDVSPFACQLPGGDTIDDGSLIVSSASSYTLTPHYRHILACATLVTASLPSSASVVVGDPIDLLATGAGFIQFSQASGQQIIDAMGGASTVGTSGYLISTSSIFECRITYLGSGVFLISRISGTYHYDV